MDFLIDLFRKAKAEGVSTTLDTCGKPFTREEPFFSKFQELMTVTDLLLFDIKHIDNKAHKELTTQSNDNILIWRIIFQRSINLSGFVTCWFLLEATMMNF